MNSNNLVFKKFNKTENNFDLLRTARRNKLYERFISEKYANTGEDPSGKFIEFANKDIIKPLRNQNIYEKIPCLTYTTWAINTTKKYTSPNKISKLQKFRNYNFIKKDNIDTDKYRNNYSKTDHISVKIPSEENIKSFKSFLESKSK